MNSQKVYPAKFQRSRGFVIPLIIAIVAILVTGVGCYLILTPGTGPCAMLYVGYRNTETKLCENFSGCSVPRKYIYDSSCLATSTIPIVGGDKDIHGCIGSAGYSWCAVKNKCLRVWEEKCEITPVVPPISTSTDFIVCTMDAKMCPDGTYVGRSAPDCKFICPNN